MENNNERDEVFYSKIREQFVLFKKLLFLLFALLSVPVNLSAQRDVTLNAVTVDIKTSKYGDIAVGGIVKFAAQSPLEPTEVFDDANYAVLNNRTTFAQYADNKLLVYYYQLDQYGYNVLSVDYYVYRCNDGVFSLDLTNDKHSLAANSSSYPTMMAYNPQDGTVYGYRNEDDPVYGSIGKIYTIDPKTGSLTLKFDLPSRVTFNSMATDAKGVTYVTTPGNKDRGPCQLYTLDMQTGERKLIGETCIYSQDVLPATFDYNTGRYFIYVPTTTAGELYEIDPATATSSKVFDVDADKLGNIRSLFSTSTVSAGDNQAPDICTSVDAEFSQPGSLQAVLKATTPQLAFDKATELNGKVSVKFYVDDSAEPVAAVEDVEPGRVAQLDYTFAAEGMHTIKAVAYNENGDGAPLSAQKYVGFDTPKAVGDVVFKLNQNLTYTLAWTAPTEGVNGGAIDTDNLTYTVTRYPDGDAQEGVIDTALSGTLPDGVMRNWYFTVKAVAGDKIGEETASNYIKSGNAFEVPYGQYFASQEEFQLHTIKDLNGGVTWQLGEDMAGNTCAEYNGNNQEDVANDWLISPPLMFHKGVTYTLTVKTSSGYNQKTGNHLGVYVGAEPDDVNTFTKRIDDITNIADYVAGGNTATITYTPDSDGVAYLGFWCHSEAKRRLFFTSYEVTAVAADAAPAAVTNLKATPGDKGVLEATISFNAPAKNLKGEALGSLKSVKIYRDNSLSALTSIDNPEPGAALGYTDDTPVQGSHTYKVIAFNEAGNGSEATVNTWVGEDKPAAVAGVKVTEDAENFYLTWNAPTSSQNGYYLDTDNMTYTVYYEYDPMENPVTYKTDISGTEITIPKSYFEKSIGGTQVLIYFYVQAVSSAGEGGYGFDKIVYGPAYKLPFSESFRNGYTGSSPWGVQDADNGGVSHVDAWFMLRDDGDSHPTKVTSYDNDNGMAVFYQKTYQTYSARLLTPRISINGIENPVATFYMYNRSGADEGNTIQLETNVNDQFNTVGDAIELNSGDGWTKHTVKLAGIDLTEFRLAFKATAFYDTDICIDKVEVADDPTSGITSVGESSLVVADGGRLTINGDTSYSVYDLAGKRVAAGQANGSTVLTLEQGCYVVKVGGKVIKTVVK